MSAGTAAVWTAFWSIAWIPVTVVLFVAFMRWSNRREAGRAFIDDFIPECADVAAIERDLPDMRDTYLLHDEPEPDDFTHDDIKALDEADEDEYRKGGI